MSQVTGILVDEAGICTLAAQPSCLLNSLVGKSRFQPRVTSSNSGVTVPKVSSENATQAYLYHTEEMRKLKRGRNGK